MTTTDHTTRPTRPRQIPDRTLTATGGIFAVAAGLLRLPASFIDPDTTGPAIDALYYAIDISLLFTLVAVYVTDATSRTTLGTFGFAIGAVGAGLLIGPEPTDATIDYYAIGAAAVTVGLALLAIGWRHSPTITLRTRVALITTLPIGAVAAASTIAFIIAGLIFSLGLIDLGHTLITSGRPAAPSQHVSASTGSTSDT